MSFKIREVSTIIENDLYDSGYRPAIVLWMMHKSETLLTESSMSRRTKISSFNIKECFKKLESEKLVKYFKGIRKVYGMRAMCIGYDLTKEGTRLSERVHKRFGDEYTSIYCMK